MQKEHASQTKCYFILTTLLRRSLTAIQEKLTSFCFTRVNKNSTIMTNQMSKWVKNYCSCEAISSCEIMLILGGNPSKSSNLKAFGSQLWGCFTPHPQVTQRSQRTSIQTAKKMYLSELSGEVANCCNYG